MYTQSSSMMDPTYSDQAFAVTYSRSPRSRAGSGVSTTEGLLQNLQLVEATSFETSSYTSSRPPSSRGLASPAYLSSSLTHSPRFLSTPLPQHQQHQHAFPALSSEAVVSDAEWFEAKQAQAQGAPILRLEPALDELGVSSSSPTLASIETEAMSAVAVSYDPTFNMGSRSFSTWPVLDSGSNLMPPDLGHYGSDASLTPPSGSRSGTSSPPRTLSAEQRELKRQRDQARHNAKMQVRGRRTDSASSAVYSPPVSLADLTTNASSMPVYTTAPSQISLLAEPAAPQYMPPYSPALPDPNQTTMFTNPYPPQSYMSDYGYPPTTTPSLPSHYGSRSLVPDPNLAMYPVAPVMGPGPADATGQVRVVHSRPKPQCWDHGCNGRQFSTFSNLLRHQREKSGQAAKATCPNCGAEFTRTTARNGHLLHDKCKKKNAN